MELFARSMTHFAHVNIENVVFDAIVHDMTPPFTMIFDKHARLAFEKQSVLRDASRQQANGEQCGENANHRNLLEGVYQVYRCKVRKAS